MVRLLIMLCFINLLNVNLYYKIKDISEYFSQKTFERHLFHELIPLLKRENRIATQKDFTTFLNHFKNKKIEIPEEFLEYKIKDISYFIEYQTEA